MSHHDTAGRLCACDACVAEDLAMLSGVGREVIRPCRHAQLVDDTPDGPMYDPKETP